MATGPPIKRSTAVVTSSVLAVLAAVLLVLFILQLSKAKGGKVQIGESEFRIPINVTRLAPEVAKAPLLFQDPRNRDLDAYVQHLGSDVHQGWLAFEAHAPGEARACQALWLASSAKFRDPCNGALYPADGTGLAHYAVRIDTTDHLIVDFRTAIGLSPPTTAAP